VELFISLSVSFIANVFDALSFSFMAGGLLAGWMDGWMGSWVMAWPCYENMNDGCDTLMGHLVWHVVFP